MSSAAVIAALAVSALGWAGAIGFVGVALSGLPDGKTAKRGKGPWLVAVVAGGLLAVLGFLLWVRRAGKTGDADSDLGSALLGSVLVGFAVLLLQSRFDTLASRSEVAAAKAQRERDETATAARRRQDDRQHAQILTSLRKELPGVDLHDRDLSGFYLPGRTLAGARFDRSILAGADFSGADLRRAVMLEAELEPSVRLKDAALAGAVLDGVSMEGADLRGADLTRTYLRRAKLRGSDLRGADLRRATFTDAEGLELCNLAGARYDRNTKWPAGFVPDGTGAEQIEPDDPWQAAGGAAPIAS